VTDKIDIWPKDEAFRRLLKQSLIFKEQHGSYSYTNWLQQELTREIVVREYHAARTEVVAAEKAAQQASDQLVVATDALEFYADGDNYKSRNGQPSAVAKDKGLTARNALLMISGTEVEVDDDEEPE
jgi:hypothetical protein